ncbi:Ig-like domain-containing protein [Curtobacterium sp. 18060]|uniref:beta strand repeat-containing protein n=1 Tax=Curtobacterium sp. 18060 TaxID=2681408 RepID=UPI00135C2A1E|nr:Ig-like domain-containing protein [Curtobacterium sp. 18060]
MSRKKRATALKSFGAAGLAAATLVSGLSFGPAASAASAAPSPTASGDRLTGKIVFKYPFNEQYAAVDKNFGSKWYSTYEAALQNAAPGWEIPAKGSTGIIKNSDGRCVQNPGWDFGGRLFFMGACDSVQAQSGTYYSTGQLAMAPWAMWHNGSGLSTGNQSSLELASGKDMRPAQSPLVAKVDSVDNVAKTAVVSGTATPGAAITVSGTSFATTADGTGKWSLTVRDLPVGANGRTIIQKVNGTEVDRVNVTITIGAPSTTLGTYNLTGKPNTGDAFANGTQGTVSWNARAKTGETGVDMESGTSYSWLFTMPRGYEVYDLPAGTNNGVWKDEWITGTNSNGLQTLTYKATNVSAVTQKNVAKGVATRTFKIRATTQPTADATLFTVFTAPPGYTSTTPQASTILKAGVGNSVVVPETTPPVALNRGATTTVPVTVKTTGARSGVNATIVLSAPAGTTFANADTRAVQYKTPDGNWTDSSYLGMRNGVRSDSNTKLTYAVNGSGFDVPAGTLMRFNTLVSTPAQAAGGNSTVGYVFAGTSTQGAFSATGSTVTTLTAAATSPITAKVDSVDNVAKTAVVSGTATPGAAISVSGTSFATTADGTGKWSLTVRDLPVGANPRTIIQKVGGVEIDRTSVTITIVENGPIIGVPQPNVTLSRTTPTNVPFVVENQATRTGMEGTVTVAAPAGTTFAPGQTTVTGQWRNGSSGAWANSEVLNLKNGRLFDNNRQMEFNFGKTGGSQSAGQQFRWNLKVDASNATTTSSQMNYLFMGTSSIGSYRVNGSTPTTLEEAPANPAPLIVQTPTNGSTVTTKRPVFSGTGDEGATIEVKGNAGQIIATATVKDGKWSAPSDIDLTNAAYDLTVTQTPVRGDTSNARVNFTVEAAPESTTLGIHNLGAAPDSGEVFTKDTTGKVRWNPQVSANPTGIDIENGKSYSWTFTLPVGYEAVNLPDPSTWYGWHVEWLKGTTSDGQQTVTYKNTNVSGETMKNETTDMGERSFSIRATEKPTADSTLTASFTPPPSYTSSSPKGSATLKAAAALTATVGTVDNVAKTAVVSGTATPGAAISVSGTSFATTADGTGKWSLTVRDLPVGANPRTIIQKVGGVEIDRTSVTITIVENGPIIGVPQPNVTLSRTTPTNVPFVVENQATRTGMEGTVTVAAPAGTTFAPGQTTVTGQWRNGSSGAWANSEVLNLKNGRLFDNNRQMEFNFGKTGGSQSAGQQFRWNLKVDASNATTTSSQMNYLFMGTSSIGSYRVNGSTPTTLEEAPANPAPLIVQTPTNGSTVTTKRPVFSGTGDEGATIEVKGNAGQIIATATVKDGKWSAPSDIDLTNAAYDLTVTQTPVRGDTSNARVNFTVEAAPESTTLGTYNLTGKPNTGDAFANGTQGTVSWNARAKTGETGVDMESGTSYSWLFTMPRGYEVYDLPAGTNNGVWKDEWITGTNSNGLQTLTYKATNVSAVTQKNVAKGVATRTFKIRATTQPTADATLFTVFTAPPGYTSTTPVAITTLKAAEIPADPAPLVVQTPANGSVVDTKRPTFSGTGDEGATIEVKGNSGRVVASATVKDGKWSAPADFDLGEGFYDLGVTQTPLTGSAETKRVNFTIRTEAPANPAPLVVQTPANGSTVDQKRPVFSGTGDKGARVEVKGTSGRVVAAAVVDDNGNWSAPATFDLGNGVYDLTATQTPVRGNADSKPVSFTINASEFSTALTATGAFDQDVTKPATISGAATTGATVVVKDSLGNEIGRVVASDGRYTIPVPANRAQFGVNEFSVTQTLNGKTSAAVNVSLDYGTPTPINITSPANGATVNKEGLTFTGTGQTGAKVTVRGTVNAIASGDVVNGEWTAKVDFPLTSNLYNLWAVQTTKGGLTTQQAITVTVTDEQAVTPLTATAAFNTTDENLPATISGAAQMDATVTVKAADGSIVGTAKATGGRYTITIPPAKAAFGVNTFTVTQTVNGAVSAPLNRSLDYGNPVAPVISTPANGATVTNGQIRFTGTGATGAKLDMRGKTSSIGDTKVANGAWTVDVSRQLTPNLYELHALQTSKGGLTKQAEITVTVQDKRVTELTAAGSFQADVEKQATISGNAQTGATVVVREGSTVIGTTTGADGKYSLSIPATVAGVRTFTVTQTVDGEVSPAKTATLDYGTATQVVVNTPAEGAQVPGTGITFTGTGQAGSKVVLGGTTSRLGEATVNSEGEWSITISRTLTPQVYVLYTKQITKGNLIGDAVVTTINVTQ